MIQKIHRGKYQVVITSPENALCATHLKPLLTTHSRKYNLTIIIDEAHCIKKWGESGFRKDYSNIGRLRAFVGEGVPFAAVSATLPTSTLEHVKSSLHIDPNNHVCINLGNFRKNLIWEVKHLSGSESAIPEIADSLPPLSATCNYIPLTIVFVNKLQLGQRVFSFVRNHVPSHLSEQVYFIHSLLSQRFKEDILHNLQTKKIGVFVCSEILAMVGCLNHSVH